MRVEEEEVMYLGGLDGQGLALIPVIGIGVEGYHGWVCVIGWLKGVRGEFVGM